MSFRYYCFASRIWNIHKLYSLTLKWKFVVSFLSTPNYCCKIGKPDRKHLFPYSVSVFIFNVRAYCQYTHFDIRITTSNIAGNNFMKRPLALSTRFLNVFKWFSTRHFPGKMLFLKKLKRSTGPHEENTLDSTKLQSDFHEKSLCWLCCLWKSICFHDVGLKCTCRKSFGLSKRAFP
jgi:hypothetical protein